MTIFSFFLMKNITVRVGQDYNPSAFKKGRGDPYEDHHIYSVTTPNAWNGHSPMEGTKCHTGKNQGVFNTYHWNFVLITLEGQISDSFFTNGKAAVADLPYAATQIVNPVVIAGYGSSKEILRYNQKTIYSTQSGYRIYSISTPGMFLFQTLFRRRLS